MLFPIFYSHSILQSLQVKSSNKRPVANHVTGQVAKLMKALGLWISRECLGEHFLAKKDFPFGDSSYDH